MRFVCFHSLKLFGIEMFMITIGAILYIISWDDYDKEMYVKIFESRFDPENYDEESKHWHETASMRHSEMLRAYAEAS